MEAIENAIEAAYQAHISSLYKVFSQSLLSANNDSDEITAAENRFKKGLDFAADVRNKARVAAGL
ncbi:MAG: hypothetical protein WBC60_18580 [Cognaticolwellia sp.]|jgi:hypothetical protein